MPDRISKLINVKSIVTLALTGVFGILCLRERISGEQFLTVYTVVMSFYFGTQFQKNKEEKADE